MPCQLIEFDGFGAVVGNYRAEGSRVAHARMDGRLAEKVWGGLSEKLQVKMLRYT